MAAASAVVGSSSFLDSYKFYQNLKNALESVRSIEQANPFYTTRTALGRYFELTMWKGRNNRHDSL